MDAPPLHTLAGRLAYALFVYESAPDRDRVAGFDYCPFPADRQAFAEDGEALAPILAEWAASDVAPARRDFHERRRLVHECAETLRRVRLPGLPEGRSPVNDAALLRFGLVAVHAAEFVWRGNHDGR